jgi:hypothetical protein
VEPAFAIVAQDRFSTPASRCHTLGAGWAQSDWARVWLDVTTKQDDKIQGPGSWVSKSPSEKTVGPI